MNIILINDIDWLGPYAYGAVYLGLLIFVIHIILVVLQKRFEFLWYRQVLSYRRLPLSRKRILQQYSFYTNLSSKYKRRFEHRVSKFISSKNIQNRYQNAVTEEQKVLIACVACQLSFGRRDYRYSLLETVLIFPEPFMSATNKVMHKGEFNPRANVLALSWEDFKEGMDITTDNLHLGLHEFTHVLHFESKLKSNMDAYRFKKYTNKILRELMIPEVRKKLEQTEFFREYAFTNQFEFMAVIVEYFFESNAQFKREFPAIYEYLKKALLYKDEWIME